MTETEATERCPRCSSPDPNLHLPKRDDGGALVPCPHPWHLPDPAREAEAVRKCNSCPFPASCSEFGRCPLDAPGPRCWDCGASFKSGEGYGDNFCSETCADAYRADLGA